MTKTFCHRGLEKIHPLLVVSVLGALILGSPLKGTSAETANWPQWRGPGSSGTSPEKKLPTEWSVTRNVLWKTAIPGKGHSSPIVWGKRVFLTTAVQGAIVPGAKPTKHKTPDGKVFDHPDSIGGEHSHAFKVLCLDTKTGKILWDRTAYEGTVYDDRHRDNSYASPTPLTDGRSVYAYFGAEGIYCYDFDGTLAWKTSVGKIATMGMGVATSPVLWKDLLILQCDQDNGVHSFLAAVNKNNGEEAWRVPRKTLESWATPIVVSTPDRAELVVNARELVIAYDPANGKELWRSEGVGVNPVPTPVWGHNMVVVAAGAGQKRAMAIRLGGSGDVTNTSQIAWKYNKGTAHVASPLLYGDYVYLLTDSGIITCLDAKGGSMKYRQRLPGSNKLLASPVAFDGKILLTSERGVSFVFKAGPVYELLSTNPIDEMVRASPAIAGGKIFLRGTNNLYAIGRAAIEQ